MSLCLYTRPLIFRSEISERWISIVWPCYRSDPIRSWYCGDAIVIIKPYAVTSTHYRLRARLCVLFISGAYTSVMSFVWVSSTSDKVVDIRHTITVFSLFDYIVYFSHFLHLINHKHTSAMPRREYLFYVESNLHIVGHFFVGHLVVIKIASCRWQYIDTRGIE